MVLSSCGSSLSVLSKNSKVIALESNLQQCVVYFRELITDLENLQIESENTKSQYISLKEKCDSKTCSAAEELQKEITKRDEIIQSVASLLIKLNETRDMNIINIAFKVLCQESSPLTPPEERNLNASKGLKNSDSSKDPKSLKDSNASKGSKDPQSSKDPNSLKGSNTSKGSKDPESSKDPSTSKGLNNSDSSKDPSTSKGLKDSDTSKGLKDSKNSDISKDSKSSKDLNTLKVTPKKQNISITEDVSYKEESLCEIAGTPTGSLSPIIQSKKTKNNLGKSTDFREKKKLPDDWSTAVPSPKAMKLIFTTPRGNKGGLRQAKISLVQTKPSVVVDLTCSPEVGKIKQEFNVQALVKKESIENDDTILPSPTSGPPNFNFKESPAKWKKPPLSLVKSEKVSPKQDENQDIKEMEESINILNRIPDRLKSNIKTETPTYTEPMDQDATHCETEFSVSLLDRVNKLEKAHLNGPQISPTKRPLQENINIVNTPPKHDPDSSVSLLRPVDKLNVNHVKRKIELVEPIYKEPTVRKKAEKRALQGWSCDDCRNFYGALYRDDPVMLARKIEECSKHRGKHNPIRPKTPEGFWNPRWEVPQDTDELNRMNDAL